MHLKRFPTVLFAFFSAAACLGVDSPATPAESTASTTAKHKAHVKKVAAGDNETRGGKRRRGALAGPSSQPADGGSADARERGPAQPLFHLMDRNRDDKLQPEEIERILNVFKAAHDASKNGDLTPEEWSKYAEQLRPQGGKPLRAKGKLKKT